MIVKNTSDDTSTLPEEVLTELQSKLSSEASITLPSDTSFAEKAQRWTEYQGPKFAAIVSVADESDIQATIAIANAHNVPFLASTAKHGDFATLSKIQGGIQIDLGRFNKIVIAADGQHVTVGGGIIAKHLTETLWAAGKVTVTGICEIVGTGLWLGGGHGLLQGLHGLASDQIVSARLVLANGSIATVSQTSSPDLFWALRGAGHNFGVVTELTLRIYDADPVRTWAHEMHFFAQDQLEHVFEALEDMVQRQGPTDSCFTLFTNMPEIDPDKPIILTIVLTAQEATHLKSYTSPLSSIPHLIPASPPTLTPYTATPVVLQSSESSPFSQKGPTFMRFGLDLPCNPSPKTARAVYDLFSSSLKATPEFAANSNVVFEAYPPHAVQRVEGETSAFPWREDRILVSPFVIYMPDSRLDVRARELGRGVRRILHEASGREGMHVYLNYAHGEESLEEIYGEEWRVRKLKGLKAKYDPEGRFGYYGGIGLDR